MLDLVITGIVAAPVVSLAANIATWCFKRAAAKERQNQREIIRSTRAAVAAERRAAHQAHHEMLGECWEKVQGMRKASREIQSQFAHIKAENESMMRELALTPEQRLAIQECNDQLERGIQRLVAYGGPYLHRFLDLIRSAQHALRNHEFDYPDLPESVLPDEFPFAGELLEFQDRELRSFPFVELGFGERGRFISPQEIKGARKPNRGLVTRYDQERHLWILSAARANLAEDLASGRAFRASRAVRLGDWRGDTRQSWWEDESHEGVRIDLPSGLMTRLAQNAPWGTKLQIYIQRSDFFLKRIVGGQEIPREHRYPAWQIRGEAKDSFWNSYKESKGFSDKLLIRESGMKGDPTSVAYVLRLATGDEYPMDLAPERGIARIGSQCGQRLGLVREGSRDFRVFVFRGGLHKRAVAGKSLGELAAALQESFEEQATLSKLAEVDVLELKRYRAVLMAEFESSALRHRLTTPFSSWSLEMGGNLSHCRVWFQTEVGLQDGCLVRIASQAEPIGWTEEKPSGATGVLVRILRSQRSLFTDGTCSQSGSLESVPFDRELQNKIDAIEDFHSAKCVEGRTQQEQDAFSKLRHELLGKFKSNSPCRATVLTSLNGLDVHQRGAVDKLMGAFPLVLVQGPPGTGKTQVIAFAVQRLVEQRPTARIAIVSQANPAVDEAIAKIQEKSPTLKIYRDYSATAKEKYASLERGVAVEDYQEALMERWNAAAVHRDESVNQIREWLSKTLMNDSTAVNRLLKYVLATRSQVVACTLSRLAGISKTAPLFDLVIVDEAAKASVPETMIAANCTKRLALVGDHHQLLPFLDESFFEHSAPTSDDREELKRLWDNSLFARLWNAAPPERKSFLQTMRRSRPAIARCVSECFYEGALIPGRDNTSKVLSFSKSLIWVDARHGRHRMVQRTKSLCNPGEVALVVEVCKEVEKLSRQKTPTVAIVAFHREQAASLNKALAAIQFRFQPNILTVDASQGGQWDVVIVSLGRTHGSSGFVGNPNRFNVAISRAKDLCVIVGRLDYASTDKTKGSCLKRVSEHFQNGQQDGKWISYLASNQTLRPRFGVAHSRT